MAKVSNYPGGENDYYSVVCTSYPDKPVMVSYSSKKNQSLLQTSNLLHHNFESTPPLHKSPPIKDVVFLKRGSQAEKQPVLLGDKLV